MFALIESGRAPRRHGEWTSRTLSLAIHAAFITAAVAATRQVAGVTPPPIAEFPNLKWSKTPQPVRASCTPCPLPGPPFPRLIPPTIPDPAPFDQPVSTTMLAPGTPGDTGVPGLNLVSPGNLVAPGDAPLESRVVDEPPEMLSHPEPSYPEILRQAGIEGRVVVEAVVDTTGRAEAGSLRIVSASNPLFATEALQVVLGSRYRPGRMAGRVVRVRVLVPISFGMRR